MFKRHFFDTARFENAPTRCPPLLTKRSKNHFDTLAFLKRAVLDTRVSVFKTRVFAHLIGRHTKGVVQQRPLLRRVLRRVLETAFEKVLRRVLRRCLAVCFTRRKGSEKGS